MVKVEKLLPDDVSLSLNAPVKVTTCGNIIETVAFSKVNRRGNSITLLGDDMYIRTADFDADTGEIKGDVKQFQRTENRGENIAGMRKSMKNLRDLINCNVTSPANCRWVTLTYAENMTDNKRLTTDHEAFIKRLKRYHVKHNLSEFEYINAVEPQGRGAWHIHSLWIYNGSAPFIENSVLRDIWKHGFVKIKKLDDVDNVGAYLTAYMCDVDADEFTGVITSDDFVKTVEITGDDGKKVKKKFIKGARLHMYPAGMNFYRTSRGIKRPTVQWLDIMKAKEKVKEATLTYSKAIRLSDDDGDFSSDILYEYYNTVKTRK